MWTGKKAFLTSPSDQFIFWSLRADLYLFQIKWNRKKHETKTWRNNTVESRKYFIHQYKKGCHLLAKEISLFYKYASAYFNIKSTSELSVKINSAGTGPKPTEINGNTSLQCSGLQIRPVLYNRSSLHHKAAMSPSPTPSQYTQVLFWISQKNNTD